MLTECDRAFDNRTLGHAVPFSLQPVIQAEHSKTEPKADDKKPTNRLRRAPAGSTIGPIRV
jgi:hypothetical protein